MIVVGSNDIKWDKYLEKLPLEKRDIYYTREYCKMEAGNEGGQAQLFVYEKGNNIAIYPVIKREIHKEYLNQPYYDIETPYGYGGPVANTADENFIRDFEQSFCEYCQMENIIAEFVRFHPLIKNQNVFQTGIEVLHNRKTVWLDLEKDIDDIWMNEVSKQNRNTIRKCIKNGLTVQVSENYETFIEIYTETMKRVNAENFYFFHRDYYRHMEESKHYVLLSVEQDEQVLAMALFMGYGEYFHYHLAGSRIQFLNLSPNNLLLWEAIKYGKEHGYQKMHFGGGLTDSMEDSLFRFKSKYAKTYADFYIGKRVHNQEIYTELITEWEREHEEKAHLLLQYRE